MVEKEHGAHQQVLFAQNGDCAEWNGQSALESMWGPVILSKDHGLHPEGSGVLLKGGLLLLLLFQRSNTIIFLISLLLVRMDRLGIGE